MMKVQTSSIMAICLAMAILAGCGSDKDGKSTTDSASNTTTESVAKTGADDTQTSATPVSAGQLDFFTERYISADERLLRRQNRIEEELSGAADAGQG